MVASNFILLKIINSQTTVSRYFLSHPSSVEDHLRFCLKFCSTWHCKLWFPPPTSPFTSVVTNFLSICIFSASSTEIESICYQSYCAYLFLGHCCLCYATETTTKLRYRSPVPVLQIVSTQCHHHAYFFSIISFPSVSFYIFISKSICSEEFRSLCI
jgi:hypothetical protein